MLLSSENRSADTKLCEPPSYFAFGALKFRAKGAMLRRCFKSLTMTSVARVQALGSGKNDEDHAGTPDRNCLFLHDHVIYKACLEDCPRSSVMT
jgi:hypothetical protein